jgi:hypothetical protein
VLVIQMEGKRFRNTVPVCVLRTSRRVFRAFRHKNIPGYICPSGRKRVGKRHAMQRFATLSSLVGGGLLEPQ